MRLLLLSLCFPVVVALSASCSSSSSGGKEADADARPSDAISGDADSMVPGDATPVDAKEIGGGELPDLEAGGIGDAELTELVQDAAEDAEVDAAPQPCHGLCGPYELCVEAEDRCQLNEDCATDFCAGAPEGMVQVKAPGPVFYMDPYEYPGKEGVVPVSGKTLEEARAACTEKGKRLCRLEEYESACGGAAALNYPYLAGGDAYDENKCNTGAGGLLAGGSRPECRNPETAIFDLSGNAAELTEDGKLFGGFAGSGEASTCKGAVEAGATDPNLIGFRCCLAPTDDLDLDSVQASLDCDDLNPDIYLGAPELCNGKDDNCNGRVDDLGDSDGDGFNVCDDCDDEDDKVFPGAPDMLGDGVDADCDGNDGTDADGDGEASTASGGTDCDDDDPLVNSGMPELCNGVDDDCSGEVDDDAESISFYCDDLDLCTEDYCDSDSHACAHRPASCDDGNACTSDSCSPELGCLHTNIETGCDDGKRCTLNDACVAGVCAGTPKNCDDGKPCTDDLCDEELPQGCYHTFNSAPCEDGDPCTLDDVCGAGTCRSGELLDKCDDNNPCTKDFCVAMQGCNHTPQVGSCSDGNPCTNGDYCMNGLCASGQDQCLCEGDSDCFQFDDGNFCNGYYTCNKKVKPYHCEFDPATIKKCPPSPAPGCKEYVCDPKDGICKIENVNEGGPCDDGNGCTAQDSCNAGVCKGKPCQELDLFCIAGKCTDCYPKCTGRVCGSDSCGATCGTCPAGYECDDPRGICVGEGMNLVPGGTVKMGCDPKDSDCGADELPQHTVTVKEFEAMRTEVSVEMYQACVKANGCSAPGTGAGCNYPVAGREKQPINCVSWSQADAFCKWKNWRLPTEAEWERAARGDASTIYPWGNTLPSCNVAIYNKGVMGCGSGGTWNVGSKPAGASQFGLLDMAGNVYEWVSDWYGFNYYCQGAAASTAEPFTGACTAASAPNAGVLNNPTGPAAGSFKVIKGGAWNLVPVFLRSSNREWRTPGLTTEANVGFRCIRYR